MSHLTEEDKQMILYNAELKSWDEFDEQTMYVEMNADRSLPGIKFSLCEKGTDADHRDS